MTNGLSHPYHLDESTFVLRGFRSIFSFLFHFTMKIKIANRIAQDGTRGYSVCLCEAMSHKKDARLIWVNCKLYKAVFKRVIYASKHESTMV